jgi:hypothetical protein
MVTAKSVKCTVCETRWGDTKSGLCRHCAIQRDIDKLGAEQEYAYARGDKAMAENCEAQMYYLNQVLSNE